LALAEKGAILPWWPCHIAQYDHHPAPSATIAAMKLQFSLATLLVCTTVLAVVCAIAMRIGVYEADLSKAVRLSPTVSRYPYLYRPPNATEIATRLAWSAPLAILLTLGVPWAIRFHPRFSLRTLLIGIALLSIPIGWVAYQLNWIRQRHALLAREDVRLRASGKAANLWQLMTSGGETAPPAFLNWFGEMGRRVLHLTVTVSERDEVPDEIVLAHKLFPEASVNWTPLDRNGNYFSEQSGQPEK